MKDRICFSLPPKGTLAPNDNDDPLNYYYKPFTGRLYRNRIEQAISLLNPPYESILEIGYGSGILLPTLASMAKSVCGVDMKSEPEKVSASLSNMGIRVNLTKTDLLSAHYPDESFDLVVAISVFEHIGDPEPIVEKLFRILRRRGQLLVGMPRVDNFMKIAFPLIGFRNIQAHHITNYKKFIRAAEKSLRLIKFNSIPSGMPEFAGLYFNMLFSRV